MMVFQELFLTLQHPRKNRHTLSVVCFAELNDCCCLHDKGTLAWVGDYYSILIIL